MKRISHDKPTRATLKSSILLLGSQMEIGGSQRNQLSQANWFYNHGYPVEVAFLYDKLGLHSDWQKKYPFPIHNLNFRRVDAGSLENSVLFIKGIARVFRLIRRNFPKRQPAFDAIETFNHHASLVGIPLAWLVGTPVRIANHRGRIRGFPNWLARIHAWIINLGIATGMIAVSEDTCADAIKEGVHPKHITIIPNGVELQKINQTTCKNLSQELNLGKDKSLVLSVGRLNQEKGHALLLEAVPEVLTNNPQTIFALAGDGDERKTLEELTTKLGIDQHIRFLGRRTDALELMAIADIFVLPSITEGMPNALLEAMGMGTAVVSFDVGGVGNVIQDGETGLLVPANNIPALAQAIIRLLKGETERSHLASAGQAHIHQNYTLERMCVQYASILDIYFQEEIE
jgi:glycosyltransferase involved in cell wall biosynthesis